MTFHQVNSSKYMFIDMESSRYPGLNGISHKSRHNLQTPDKEQIVNAQDSLISPNAEDRGAI